MVKHKCPFLRHHKYCDLKPKDWKSNLKLICNYKDCRKCPFLKESKTKLKFDEEEQSDNKNV